MKKRIACLHAHYSNIEYIERSLSEYDVDIMHFVDPALMHRVTHDKTFTISEAKQRVKEQIVWMSKCQVDAILITCTNYIAILADEELPLSIPILKIDEPYFEYLCKVDQPQMILFTNPATVQGTMDRLYDYANRQGKTLAPEVVIINDTFELMMEGKTKEYNQAVMDYLLKAIENEDKTISVAQLSMVDAAEQVENVSTKTIINPLQTLISSLVQELTLKKHG